MHHLLIPPLAALCLYLFLCRALELCLSKARLSARSAPRRRVTEQPDRSAEVTDVEQSGKVTLTLLSQHTGEDCACLVNELCTGAGQAVTSA